MSKHTQQTHQYISPWIVVALGIVTLGIYACAWTARRYKETNPEAGWVSHWLVPTMVVLVAIALSISFRMVAPFIVSPEAAAVSWVYSNIALLGVAGMLVTWWMVYYMRRIDTSQPLIPLILMSFFFSPLAAYYLQIEISDQPEKGSKVLRWSAVIASTLLGAGTIILIYMQSPIDQEITTLETEYRMTGEYIKCHEALGARFPNEEIGAYQYQTYLDAYDDCESIID